MLTATMTLFVVSAVLLNLTWGERDEYLTSDNLLVASGVGKTISFLCAIAAIICATA